MPVDRFPSPKCYLVVAYAPPAVGAAQANRQFNEYVADAGCGLALTHDHFLDRRGGFAVFACEDPAEARQAADASALPGWDIRSHPLTFADDGVRWLYQMDFTMARYRGGRRLSELIRAYEQSDEFRRLNESLDGERA